MTTTRSKCELRTYGSRLGFGRFCEEWYGIRRDAATRANELAQLGHDVDLDGLEGLEQFGYRKMYRLTIAPKSDGDLPRVDG